MIFLVGGLVAPAIVVAAAASLVAMTACGFRLARGLPRLGRALRHRRRHREMLRLVAREDGRHADVVKISPISGRPFAGGVRVA